MIRTAVEGPFSVSTRGAENSAADQSNGFCGANGFGVRGLTPMRNTPTRRLIWVPIVHSEADLGNMSELVKGLHIRRMGRAAWNRHVQTIHRMWEDTRAKIDELGLDCGKVRLYQDGLPKSGHEARIVADLARAGSQNHALLLELMKRGAQLTGTESPDLLLEEYEMARRMLVSAKSGGGQTAGPVQSQLSKRLLEKRDRYIAEQIGRTLALEETGLVFLGMLHSLGAFLPSDIQMVRLEEAWRVARQRAGRRPPGS
jgi:hypothetical protein